MKPIFTLLLATLLTVLIPAILCAKFIEGKVSYLEAPGEGVEVHAYPVSTLDFNQPSAHLAGPTTADGTFRLKLPVGEYYLIAKGDHRFGYYGRNPITVPDKGLENVNLLVTRDDLPLPEAESSLQEGVIGTVSLDGKAVENALVMIYPDLSSGLKGMGLAMTPPTGPQGYFELPVNAGSYYLVVRVRKNGQMAGPLRAGDLFGYLADNPLMVKAGVVTRVHIPLIEVPEKVSRHAASLFGNTSVSGRVLDSQGQPVAGLQVLLYDDAMMLNRPLYVSQKTAADGRYQLSFPKGGHYYLAARSELGGTPAPGELYGRYQGTPDHSIEIETGDNLSDLEIMVDEVY